VFPVGILLFAGY